ncbi:uncharacterized protein PADG_11225 [Paracoccidioides brasiliensis Pb18]|uniref:Uncharacterized protein n=1 Tax=Paracoccidioides brasiliensis (strain Pb18) TaxID=502780 RepID=A0A0A0HUX4_PARBD|nr:uncharacterized protein PADG_11225 [Paracoccidioides brasiliensis Pb18]KGM92412.1 hypothetical protein PADG_11225 [Paracoccidioides brasiliensis Pb18]
MIQIQSYLFKKIISKAQVKRDKTRRTLKRSGPPKPLSCKRKWKGRRRKFISSQKPYSHSGTREEFVCIDPWPAYKDCSHVSPRSGPGSESLSKYCFAKETVQSCFEQFLIYVPVSQFGPSHDATNEKATLLQAVIRFWKGDFRLPDVSWFDLVGGGALAGETGAHVLVAVGGQIGGGEGRGMIHFVWPYLRWEILIRKQVVKISLAGGRARSPRAYRLVGVANALVDEVIVEISDEDPDIGCSPSESRLLTPRTTTPTPTPSQRPMQTTATLC